MLRGKFIDDYPFITITIASHDFIEERLFIIDTGFSGYLWINRAWAKQLKLETNAVATVMLADSRRADVQKSKIKAILENRFADVEVLISDSLPLVGIKFLSLFGCKLEMNCKNRTLSLECI